LVWIKQEEQRPRREFSSQRIPTVTHEQASQALQALDDCLTEIWKDFESQDYNVYHNGDKLVALPQQGFFLPVNPTHYSYFELHRESLGRGASPSEEPMILSRYICLQKKFDADTRKSQPGIKFELHLHIFPLCKSKSEVCSYLMTVMDSERKLLGSVEISHKYFAAQVQHQVKVLLGNIINQHFPGNR
jgi:hypothetical protein